LSELDKKIKVTGNTIEQLGSDSLKEREKFKKLNKN
jgi:hypothetical protein